MVEQKNAKRNPIFSIMKGIAILSVVIGHAFVNTPIECFVNQYHLAVFYFIAGYFLKEESLSNSKLYFWKKIKSLYIPYVAICLLFIVLHNVLYAIHFMNEQIDFHTMIALAYHTCIKLNVGPEKLLGALWFCPSLLIVCCISFLVFKLIKNKEFWLPYCIAIFSIMALISFLALKLNLKSPYNIWQTIPLCFIFMVGFLTKKYNIFAKLSKIAKLIIVIFTILFILFAQYSQNYAHLQPWLICKENIIFVVFLASVSAYGLYCMSELLSQSLPRFSKILILLGECSFSIMAFHFFAFRCVNYLQCVYNNYDFSKITDYPHIEYNNYSWAFLYIFIGCMMPLFFSWIWRKTKKIKTRI